MKKTQALLVASCIGACAFGGTLTWAGGASGTWNKTDANWRNEGGSDVAWTDGETAVVDDAGVMLNVTEKISVGGLSLANGVAVGGVGEILLNGDVSVAGGAAASLSLPVWARDTTQKTGGGDLAANMLAGPVTVKGGRLLTGGLHSDRATVTENGGTREWQTASSASANLIANGSFEDGAPSDGYKYVKGSDMPTGWVNDSSDHVVTVRASGTAWGIGGAAGIPDGAVVLGLQRHGNISQTITVPADGFYELSYTSFRRVSGETGDHFVSVEVDGIRRFSQLTVWPFIGDASNIKKLVRSGPIWFTAGEHQLHFAGQECWGDRTTFIDAVELRACAAGSAPAAENETFIADGVTCTDAVTLNSVGNVVYLTKTGSGTSTISGKTSISETSVFTVDGRLELSGGIGRTSNTSDAYLAKRGVGTLGIRGSISNMHMCDVYEGSVECDLVSGFNFRLNSRNGVSPVLKFNLTKDVNITSDLCRFLGDGFVRLNTTGTGHLLNIAGIVAIGSAGADVGIGQGDTIRIRTFRSVRMNKETYPCAVMLDGPGTLDLVQSVQVDDDYGYLYNATKGSLSVANGTLNFSVSDCAKGAAHPITHDIQTLPALLGDMSLALAPAGSPEGATPRIKLGAANVAVARALSVGPGGVSATIEGAAGETGITGAITLGREVTTAIAPEGGVLRLGALAKSSDFAGTPKLIATGAGTVKIVGAVSGGIGLAVAEGGTLTTGEGIGAVSVASFELNGTYRMNFNEGICDKVTVGNLILGSDAKVCLWDSVSAIPFATVGRYELFKYDTLEGDVASLAVSADSLDSDYDYAFENDAANKTVVLVIEPSATSSAFIWSATGDGAWATGANWERGSVPASADATVFFAGAATSPATVTVGNVTLGKLCFANNNSYTVTGGTLTFAPKGAARPVIRVTFGTHVIASALATTDGGAIEVAVSGGGRLVIDGAVSAPVNVTAGDVRFGDNAVLNAKVTMADGSAMNVSETIRIPATGADVAINGAIAGNGRIVKEGNAALEIGGSLSKANDFSGTVEVKGGTLRLGEPGLANATLEIAPGATAESAVRHGLVGTFRSLPASVNNDDRFKSVVQEQVYDLAGIKNYINSLAVITNVFFGGEVFEVWDADAESPNLPEEFRNVSGAAHNEHWAVSWEGVLDAPVSGEYVFACDADDCMVMALDGKPVLRSKNAVSVLRSVYLEKGPHTLYLALIENTYFAKLRIRVKRPDETEIKGLPIAWLTPKAPVKAVRGGGTINAPEGTVFTVGQPNGLDTAFTGALSGNGTIVKTGYGVLGANDVTAKSVLLDDGEIHVVAPGTEFDALSSSAGADTISVLGASSVKSVYGNAKVAFGSHLYWRRRLSGDSDCGIATNRTYTHLLSFPIDAAAARATVNGVTFNTIGVDKYSIVNKPGITRNDAAQTGFKSLFSNFICGVDDYTIVLTGLTPNAAYDCRFYWMNYGVGAEGGDGTRTGTFTFMTSDNNVNRTLESHKCVLEERDKSSRGSSYDVIGCRYRAGADGVLKLRVQSSTSRDTVHLYALSNELMNDTPVANEETTILTESGTRSQQNGALTATTPLTIAGAGEQRLGGPVSTSEPLSVNGKLVLTRGANIDGGLDIANGGSVTMHGGTTVKSLAGAGEVKLSFGDKRPYGAVQADGTFAAADNFRIDTFTGDADCGISPSKNYLLTFNYRTNPTGDRHNNITYVNEVPFMISVPSTGLTLDNTWSTEYQYYDVYTQGRLCPLPRTPHAGGNNDYIGIPSTESVYNILYAMTYDNGNNTRTKMVIGGMTAGTTYEVRFYERTWDSKTVDTRNIRFEFDPNGSTTTPTITQTVAIDKVGRSATGAYLPYVIAFRIKATTSYACIWFTSLASDTWHLYGASVEKVEPEANVRTFNITSDQTFGGKLSGIGEVSKLGKGALTLTGDVNAQGFWTVNDGALFLTDAEQMLGNVSVKAGTFGGIGAVAGDLGVSGTATLALNGEFNVGGTLAIGEGVNVVVSGNATCTAKAVSLPAVLAIKPVTKLSKRLTLFTSDDGIGAPDTTGWVVYKEDGVTPDCSAAFSVSPNGKSIMLNPSCQTVIFIR